MRHFNDDEIIRPQLLTIGCIHVRLIIGEADIAFIFSIVLPACIRLTVPLNIDIVDR